jgi:hypothetical protein
VQILKEKEMDWELRALKAETAKHEMATALYICAAIAGWAIGGWAGFGVFILFAAIAGSA